MLAGRALPYFPWFMKVLPHLWRLKIPGAYFKPTWKNDFGGIG